MKNQSRVLIISYNVLSKEGANGRTMEFLVHSFDKENLAQLFFSNEKPDFDVCKRYYRITEKQLLKVFFSKKSTGDPVKDRAKAEVSTDLIKESSLDNITKFAKKNKRATVVKFLRNYLWGATKKQWFNDSLKQWIQEFSPDVILTVSGKNSCFHAIVLDIAKKYSLPVVVYHCEDYCFKNMFPKSLLYKKYIRGLKKSVDDLMDYASLAIYNSDAISNIYSKEYSTPSMVAYMSTQMLPVAKKEFGEPLIFSYMGNLSLGRDESLLQVAKALYSISPMAKIDVYAPNISDEFSQKIKEVSNMEYKGFISYDECMEVIAKSDILLHAESFDEKIKTDLQIAFSTKIADSLASGVAFFVYAPKGIASTDYLLKHDAACVATTPEELNEKLNDFIKNADLRRRYIDSALNLVKENHTLEKTVKEIESKINCVSKMQ
ncbi:MAG: glycosyltransferase [Ruminococcaceae bacterium]|nr:glycosyltransferase [Oscillospiraceae bacterium]